MPGKVARITPENLRLKAPAALRRLEGWLLWRYEQHEDEAKPRKVPYYASGGKRFGKQGGPRDRAKLVTFAAAVQAAARLGMDGVGLAMLEEWGFVAVDIDKCVRADGSLPEDVARLCSYSYSEFSPSGTGVRLFFVGNVGTRKSLATAEKYGLEVFSTSGFVTFTGHVTEFCEVFGMEDVVAEVPDMLLEMCDARFGTHAAEKAVKFDPNDPNSDPFLGKEPRTGMSYEDIAEHIYRLDPSMGRDQWIRVGMGLHHEFEGGDDGFELWDEWSSQGDNYVSTEDLQKDWDSFERRKDDARRNVTLRSVLKLSREADDNIDISSLMETSKAALAVADMTNATTKDDYDGDFKIESITGLLGQPPLGWWIKGVLPQGELGMLYGQSGTGKTFVGIDLAMTIALGRPWHGRRVKRGRVLYVAAEGGVGIGRRFEAYCRKHGIDPADASQVGLLRVPPNIIEWDDVSKLIDAIANAGGFDVIIIDTLAQTTPGANENTSEDMGKALKNCRRITEMTKAMVILVHHAGKDTSKGARGWSGIKAAVDVEMEVFKHENGQRELKLTKLKDGEDGLKWSLHLEQLVLGQDDDGDPITSCVAIIQDAVPVPEPEKGRRGVKRYGTFERHVLEMMRAEPFATAENAPYDSFVDACAGALPFPEAGKRDVRKQNVRRAIASLSVGSNAPLGVKHGRVVFYGEGG